MPSRVSSAIVALSLAGCASMAALPPPADSIDGARTDFRLRLIGSQTLNHALQFGGTTVGGLSGIDRDARHDLYYLISDDRSQFAPTRFYTARLAIDETRFDAVALQTVVTLRTPDGVAYPPGAADAEAIRYDPVTHDLWWTSEGERSTDRSIDPFVRRATTGGVHVGEVPLDPMFRVDRPERGPRDNRVFEGATLSPDGKVLWIAMEGPFAAGRTDADDARRRLVADLAA